MVDVLGGSSKKKGKFDGLSSSMAKCHLFMHERTVLVMITFSLESPNASIILRIIHALIKDNYITIVIQQDITILKICLA